MPKILFARSKFDVICFVSRIRYVHSAQEHPEQRRVVLLQQLGLPFQPKPVGGLRFQQFEEKVLFFLTKLTLVDSIFLCVLIPGGGSEFYS